MSDYDDAFAFFKDSRDQRIEATKRQEIVERALKIKKTPAMLEAFKVLDTKRLLLADQVVTAFDSLKILETKIANDKEKRVILKKLDGSCRIMAPGKRTKLTIEEIVAKDTPSDSEPIIIEDLSIIPTDTTFKKAWMYDSSTSLINIDMNTARIIQTERIDALKKKKRNEHLEEFLGALLDEDTEKENNIKAQNKKIKDLPISDFAEINNPEELKNSIPSELL